MGASKRFVLSDLGGGLNQGLDPTDIDDKELQDVRNFYPWSKRLIKRPGSARVSGPNSENRYAEETTGGFPYKTSLGTWLLLVGGLTSIGKLSGSSLVQLPHISGTTYTSSYEPWSFSQYNDIVYATREDAGSLQRINSSAVGDAGISAPSTAPTIAEGAAGNLDAGDYIAVVTYYNSGTGMESNPSAVSNTLTLAASKQINWTSIPVSSNSQVTSRRLYRTLVDQQGVYYLVDEIEDNITTTYTDNVIETALGVDASFDNGTPPAALKYNAIWQERMWVSDGTDLYYSEIGLMEAFGDFNFLSFTPDDGHKIKGFLPFGDKLIVGKTNKTFIVSGVDKFDSQSLSDTHGVFSHHSMQAADGRAFWFGGDNFYWSDGNQVKAFGDVSVRTLIDGIDLTYASRMVAAIDKKKGWYMCLVPSDGATRPDLLLVYNYRDDSWTIFDYLLANASTGSPYWLGNFYDSSGEELIYSNMAGGDEDSVFQLFVGTSDDNRNITAYVTTKSYGFDKEDILKFMKDISTQMTIADQTVTATLLKDSGTVSDLGAKDYSLSGGRLWKRVPLANNGDPAVSMALKLSVTGKKQLEILGITFKIVDLERTVAISEFT